MSQPSTPIPDATPSARNPESVRPLILPDPIASLPDRSLSPVAAQPWTQTLEDTIIQLYLDAYVASQLHARAGSYFKKMENRWSFPAMAFPYLTAPLVAFFSQSDTCGKNSVTSEALATAALVISGGLNSVNTYFRYGRRTGKHMELSSRYADLSTDILAELSRSRAFRSPVDICTTRYRMLWDSLVEHEPMIPGWIQEKHQAAAERAATRRIQRMYPDFTPLPRSSNSSSGARESVAAGLLSCRPLSVPAPPGGPGP